MTRKDQIKLLNDKIESNTNQYKLDRLNAEISAFSSGDLNKYEFLTRKDLKYKTNALDKAKFEFSPLGKAFSIGLHKTAQGYQEEGVIKLLKYIKDGLACGVNRRPNDNRPDDSFDDDSFDKPYTSYDEDDIKNNKKKTVKTLKINMIFMVLIYIPNIKILMMNMILTVLIYITHIKIMMIYMILMGLI